MQHVIVYESGPALKAGIDAFKAHGIREDEMELLEKPRIPWSSLALGAIVGAALASLVMFTMEILYYGVNPFGWSTVYPLMGVALALLIGLVLGALVGCYLDIRRHGDPLAHRKALSDGKKVLLVRGDCQKNELAPILQESGGHLLP